MSILVRNATWRARLLFLHRARAGVHRAVTGLLVMLGLIWGLERV